MVTQETGVVTPTQLGHCIMLLEAERLMPCRCGHVIHDYTYSIIFVEDSAK
jgi:hypothetical protein